MGRARAGRPDLVAGDLEQPGHGAAQRADSADDRRAIRSRFTWARTPEIRLVKDLGPNFAIGVSAENSATTFTGTNPSAGTVISTSLNGCGGSAAVNGSGASALNACNTYSTNQIPDFLGKVTFDPTIADHKVHLEAYGVLRDFYDRTIRFPAP